MDESTSAKYTHKHMDRGSKEGLVSHRANLALNEHPTVTAITLFELRPITFFSPPMKAEAKQDHQTKNRQKYSQHHRLCSILSGPEAQTI